MNSKKLIFILLAAGISLVLIGMVLIAGMARFLRGSDQPTPPAPKQITLCDVNASGICVVSFGADPLDQMVINLHLPADDYPAMLALVHSRAVSTEYPCRAVGNDPRSVYCTGPKTPLAEPIEIQLMKLGSDEIIAQGTLVVLAIALPSPMNFTAVPGDLTGQPIETPSPFLRPLPGATRTAATAAGEITPAVTRTPGTAVTLGSSPTITATGTPTLTPTPTYTGTP